jgi:hypothetical protein
MSSCALNILELIKFFEDKLDKRNSRRAKTEHYLDLIREQILITRKPHTPVRPIYIVLTKEKGCAFSYQYFMKLIESNWNTLVDENGRCCLIVSSERDKLCRW